ncbi:MAG: hydrogen peroxide-inducible genes activator [Chromatiaceae bacterium]
MTVSLTPALSRGARETRTALRRHFGRAADACFVTQPTLSVAVKKLEDELGVSLFERGVGEVTVTEVGDRIVAQAQRVLEEAEAVKRLARQGKDPLTGTLRLGAIYTIGPYVLPQLIPLVREQAPAMPLMIQENFTSVLSDRLKRGDLDVIIISMPFDEPGISTRLLYDEPFVVLLPAAHPWGDDEVVTPARLGAENVLLLGPGHCFRDQVLQACPKCLQSASSGSLQRSLEGGSLETIRCMVASGAGITVLPCTAARVDGFSNSLVRICRLADPVPNRRVALAWRRSFPRLRAVDVIEEAVRAAFLNGVTYVAQEEEMVMRAASSGS